LERLKTVARVQAKQAQAAAKQAALGVKCQNVDYMLFQADTWLAKNVPHGGRYFMFFAAAQVGSRRAAARSLRGSRFFSLIRPSNF
jgi:hypothetical protein